MAENFPRLFLLFPQGSSFLHSFRTTQLKFSIAIDSVFTQSVDSASVKCIEPAGDCSRAGGNRRFSRVNRREGFQECASALSRKLGRCGLLRRVLPKKQDFSRPLTQSLRVTICESCICGLIACRVCRECAFLRECGFRAHTSPPSVAKRQAQRSRAMRPRWLAWAAFIFGVLWPRIFTDHRGSGKKRSQDTRQRPVSSHDRTS